MTTNQINYWSLQENKRHNVTTENETNRHNVTTEGIDLGRLNEQIRHNKATEGISLGNLQELVRHNYATEGLTGADLNIKAGQLSETRRHNVVGEGIDQQRADAYELGQTAQAQLNDVKRTWESLLSSTQVDINAKQKDKISAEIKKLEQDAANAAKVGNTIYWQQVLNSINTLNNTIDAFIPG